VYLIHLLAIVPPFFITLFIAAVTSSVLLVCENADIVIIFAANNAKHDFLKKFALVRVITLPPISPNRLCLLHNYHFSSSVIFFTKQLKSELKSTCL